MSAPAELPVRHVLGVAVHAVTLPQVIGLCEAAVRERRPLMIGVVNAAKLVKMRGDALLRKSVVESDLVLADGMGVVWASRLLGAPLPERVPGIDLFEELLRSADRNRFSVYLLGATHEVVEAVASRIRERHPRARIAGLHDGYFSDDEAEKVAREIASARPDLLFVAMSTPKKELFLEHWASKLDVPVCHGVGGSFDVFAGYTRRAPLAWQRVGLEWLYRLLQEPGRMWKRYLTTNSQFAWWVAREWWRARWTRPS
jgi:N-acetylglucosaminyldiphosphoundecaprenol N-acetyl-beta-D-mannosaminyltransferase